MIPWFHRILGYACLVTTIQSVPMGVCSDNQTPPQSNSPIAEQLTKIDGSPASLEDSKPKRLVFFWGTWCGHCQETLTKVLPKLNERQDVTVVTVNLDMNPERVDHFVKTRDIRLPVFRDPTRAYRKQLRIFSVPSWAVYRKSEQGWKLKDTASAFNLDRVEVALSDQEPLKVPESMIEQTGEQDLIQNH